MSTLGLGLGLGFRSATAAGGSPPVLITGVSMDDLQLRQNDAVGTVIGNILTSGGTAPFTYTIGGADAAKVDEVSGALLLAQALGSSADLNITIAVLDAAGQTWPATAFVLDTLATATPPNPPPLDEDDGTVVDDGTFEIPPIVSSAEGGLKLSGKSGGQAKFIFDIGEAVAGVTYTYTYEADFSLLSKLGQKAFVGFGFKQGNDFHFVGQKGDGTAPANQLAYQVYGAGKFNGSSAPTFVNGGAVAFGSRNGPNYIRIAIDAAGETFTFYTGNGSGTWTAEFTAEFPTPLDEAVDATTFGLAVFLESDDKGVFVIELTAASISNLLLSRTEISTSDTIVGALSAIGGQAPYTYQIIP